MNLAEHLDILFVIVTLIIILSGYHVAFALGGTAILFALLGIGLDAFPAGLLNAIPSRIFGIMTNPVLVAVPLFIFMGVMLERSRLAEELLQSAGDALGRVRGGLALGVIGVGALLAASTGIVGATVVTMALLSLPTMLKRGYDPALACGTIAASGTLGQIIPPSIVLVLLGDVMSNAWQRAQREAGNFAPEPVGVGDLFAGALIPGLLLVGAYMAYIGWLAMAGSRKLPPLDPTGTRKVRWVKLLSALVPPLMLIFAVLGSILGGIATATEAAALGAAGALLLAGLRPQIVSPPHDRLARGLVLSGILAIGALVLISTVFSLRTKPDDMLRTFALVLSLPVASGIFAAIYRLWKPGILSSVTRSTGEITAMVFMILIGATIFTLVFRGFGGDHLIEMALHSSASGLAGIASHLAQGLGLDDLSVWLSGSDQALAFFGVLIVMIIMFLLGFFLDFLEIIFVVVPLVAPPLLMLGVDPVWLGVMIALNLQTSFLTPPFGFALFYLRGAAPAGIHTRQIYRGAMPFIAIQVAMLLVIALIPGLATWLPSLVYS
jgi:tripartite ATP-independent transporter DctM subunit